VRVLQFFELEIELLSPAIVASRITRSGYIRPLDYVPGSTLRGALLAALYRYGYVGADILKQEAREPSLLSSPAWPVAPLGDPGVGIAYRRSLPATPVTFKCKVCGKSILNLRDVAAGIAGPGELRLAAECPDHGPAESLYSRPIFKYDSGVREFDHKVVHAVSVSINKLLGTAMKGMLFSYEAVAEGTRFWARLVAPNSIAERIPDQLRVAVGRGSSRGFGLSLVKVKRREAPELSTTTYQVFVSLSPVTPLTRLSYWGCELRVSRVLGRTMKVLGGWDMALGRSRPFVELVKPGAVVAAEVRCEDQERARTFAALLSYGGIPVRLGDTWLTGVNVMVSVEEYERLLGESLG